MELYNFAQQPQQFDLVNAYAMPGQDMMEDTDNLQLNMLNEDDAATQELFWKKMKKIGSRVSRGISTARKAAEKARGFVPSKYRGKFDKGLGAVRTADRVGRNFRLQELEQDIYNNYTSAELMALNDEELEELIWGYMRNLALSAATGFKPLPKRLEELYEAE